MNPHLKHIQMSRLRIFHDLVKKTENVIDFTLGDGKDDACEEVKKATIESIENNETHYSDSQGLLELRKQLSLKEAAYSCQEFCITSGATQGLFEVLMTLFDQGDGILIGIPLYPSYVSLMTLFGLQLQGFPFDEQFQINEACLESHITKNSKAILVNHPHNPSGSILNCDSIGILYKMALKYDLMLIWDAVYYECGSYPSLYHETVHEKLIQIHSFSKSSQMCGYRIGYICADKKWISEIMKVHQLNQSCLPVFIQRGAMEALNHKPKRYIQQKKYLIQRMKEMGLLVIENDGPYYVLFSIEKLMITSEAFAKRLLKEYQVAVLPGKYFCFEYHIRMSCCIELEKCKEGCDRMEAFVRLL